MNPGIAGRWALVSAASKGLGKASAQALVSEGVTVVILNDSYGSTRLKKSVPDCPHR